MKRKILREDILQSGLKLMFENGYYATGIKEITEDVKIPKGSFYNHFENKEEFGLEVVKMYCDNGVKMYQNTFLNSNLSPIKRIESFFDRLIEAYSGSMNFRLGCVMGNFSAELADVNPKFRILLDEEFMRCQKIIELCIVEGIEKGEMRVDMDARQMASFFLNSWHGALLRMKSAANSVPLVDCKDLIMTMLRT